jgi:phage terminase small subunit
MKLTPKQKAFCDYYIQLGNATEAAANTEIDTMAAMNAENRIQAHERAIVMLQEKRDAVLMGQIPDVYTSKLTEELQALEQREQLMNADILEQLQALAQQITDKQEAYNQIHQHVTERLNEYKPFMRRELSDQLAEVHKTFTDQKHVLYSNALESLNSLMEKLQQENTCKNEQMKQDELTKVSGEINKLDIELARYKHQTAVTSWDHEYMRATSMRIQELRTRYYELTGLKRIS